MISNLFGVNVSFILLFFEYKNILYFKMFDIILLLSFLHIFKIFFSFVFILKRNFLEEFKKVKDFEQLKVYF
jgi:hypothetical protein